MTITFRLEFTCLHSPLLCSLQTYCRFDGLHALYFLSQSAHRKEYTKFLVPRPIDCVLAWSIGPVLKAMRCYFGGTNLYLYLRIFKYLETYLTGSGLFMCDYRLKFSV